MSGVQIESDPIPDAEAAAVVMIRNGGSDEQVEATTGLPLEQIIGLRARASTPQLP